MSEVKRVGDLEIGQDMPFQRLQWKVERVGWIIMAFIILAALLGLLGPGPLSSMTAGEKNSGLWVEYNRFERYQSPNSVKVHMGPGAARGGAARLTVNRDFIENVQLIQVTPEPQSVESSAEHFTYVFNVPDASHPVAVTFHFEPNKFGTTPIRLGIDGGPEVSFWQFYYP